MSTEQIVEAIRARNTRNSKLLADFVEFCLAPEASDIRFWQALSIWSKWPFVLVAKEHSNVKDYLRDNIKMDKEGHLIDLSIPYDTTTITDTFGWEENHEPD